MTQTLTDTQREAIHDLLKGPGETRRIAAQSRFLGKWGRLVGLRTPGSVRGLSGDWQSYRDGGVPPTGKIMGLATFHGQ